MKKWMLVGLGLCLGACSALNAEGFKLGLDSGLLGSTPLYGFHAVKQGNLVDLTLSYMNVLGVKNGALASDGMDMHNLGLEAYIPVCSYGGVEGSIGGGVGFLIPNLNSGVSETADNEVSWTFGVKARKDFSKVSLETSLGAFIATLDSHVTVRGSHLETFQVNGVDAGQVEVADETHWDNWVNVSNVLWKVSLLF